ncbi:MAG: NAD-glutamate dehydrogenase, partial [Gammaproteobacteria bacterium]|nr:NAD-glutamate dehydrogenase [Gammaproteobacteria bacterium]
MPLTRAQESEDLISRVINDAAAKLKDTDRSQLETFIKRFYDRVAPEDLVIHSVIDLSGAALAFWHIARQRKPNESKVHVYNPHFEKHGWQSSHTVVEVIADDMPFLVDSVSMALNRYGLTIHLTIHPVFHVKRNDKGQMSALSEAKSDQTVAESYMHFQVDRQTEPKVLKKIQASIEDVLNDVRLACADWLVMREQILTTITELEKQATGFEQDDINEAIAFCQWIEADHFTFLGYCEFDYKKSGNNKTLEVTPDSQIGILRELGDVSSILPIGRDEYSDFDDLLIVTKANRRATVHRPAYMDFIGIKRFDKSGKVNGERCIVGLFTSAAYNRNTSEIPLLRNKVKRVMNHTGLSTTGHAAKALQNIIEVFPRDSVFQISDEELFEMTNGILELQERHRIRLFTRRDTYRRFYLCLVYLPRERYSREMRLRIQRILMDAYHGTNVEFDTLFSESVLARIQFTIYSPTDSEPKYDTKEVEKRIIDAARSWQDHLRDALTDVYGEGKGNTYFHNYTDAFPVSYRGDFPARTAAFDIDRIDGTSETGEISVNFYRPLSETEGGVRLKLFAPNDPVSPSDTLPMIENMGLKVIGERPYDVRPRDGTPVWIHEFELISRDDAEIDPEKVGDNFQDAFVQVWKENIENDGFNQLVLGAGLTWRETVIVRAYSRYLKQIKIPYSESYIIETLSGNPRMAQRLVRLFNHRFDPALQDNSAESLDTLMDEINAGLDRVANLDEDRILRGYLDVIQATVRTNFFQPGAKGEPKSYVSIKLEPKRIVGMPKPVPMFEIFVYSPRVEAVHLRGGMVARGGLRWSDRREDFRTEILGLVKAQLVKNAVIVPTGSKGGFIVKRPPDGDREALMAEVIECYKTFMRGLLDITDNLDGDKVIPPKDVVRHDDDDPYLVIAADKGTATFSDIANSVSEEYGFWLGDAYASGGSVGYDHKKMGITARGAWESVKRHFRELDHDTQTEDFSVIGIGDMGGDVFGNGMLLSRHIKLVGAFNHMHVFMDPNPDPEKSFIERGRLFDLPRSSWTDYEATLISEGGGIYERSAKSIPVSTQMQEILRINQDSMTPNDLINAMLKAPVDLIWNGGIGTYIKAESETHDEVSDRANDGLRVNGKELRCKVLGEGGNLGVTQLGRIEFSQHGGLCYTDSIDNSAGVDTSDHEVNIKILLDRIVADGDMTAKQRTKLLSEMTDEVADLVLRDNYNQTQAISVTASRASELFSEQMRYIRHLERQDKLDSKLEYLPDNEESVDRATAGDGLVRPELAILLSYSKIDLYDQLIQSDVPEDPFLRAELERYFPVRLGDKFRDNIYQHRLKREIIATYITNSLVNRAGPTFAFRLADVTGATAPDIARAYTAAREIFQMRDIWSAVEALDNKTPAKLQMQMLHFASGLVERATVWLLRHRRAPLDIADTVEFFKDGVSELIESFPKPMSAEIRLRLKRRTKSMVSSGVPEELATRVACFVPLSTALDIVEVAKNNDQEVATVGSVYYDLGARLHLLWLRDQTSELSVANHWHYLAKWSLRSEFHNQQRILAGEVIDQGSSSKPKTMVDNWIQ